MMMMMMTMMMMMMMMIMIRVMTTCDQNIAKMIKDNVLYVNIILLRC